MPKVTAPPSAPAPEKQKGKEAAKGKDDKKLEPKSEAAAAEATLAAPAALPEAQTSLKKKPDDFQDKPGEHEHTAQPPAHAAEPKAAAMGANYVLETAQDAGVHFRERERREGQEPSPEDAELLAAVAEAAQLLRDVKGIEAVVPGENEAKAPVVLIRAMRGFTEASLKRIPQTVGRFATLLALPYELLPLRRE